MATKKVNLIQYELEFLETKLQELRDYIESNPFSSLQDRMAYKETKNGGAIPICIANKEAQRKDLTQALKDYVEILQSVDKLRSAEEAKVELRGNSDMSTLAEDFLKSRK
jgi:hypothetical protein